jgi:hypothetical protein
MRVTLQRQQMERSTHALTPSKHYALANRAQSSYGMENQTDSA